VRQARKKLVKSRGARASVTPGGDGFECPASGCKSVFDTAEEALEHGATHGLSGEREVDDEGKSCCLWQGCGKKVKVTKPSRPKPEFTNLRVHEVQHTKGPKPREGFVCPECDEAYPTSAAAWACAATHDVEEDPKKCLWAGCGLTFGKPSNYRNHEPVRVPAPARGGVAARAAPPEPPRPSTRLLCLSRPPLSRPTPAARRRCTRESGRTTAPRATRATSVRVRPTPRHTPHAQPRQRDPLTPSPALGRVGDALLQGHRRVQVRLEHEGFPRPNQLQEAQSALRPRRVARAAGLSRPARRPADGAAGRARSPATTRHAPPRARLERARLTRGAHDSD
jgi:hypothetical protein